MSTRNFESTKGSGEIWNPTKDEQGDPRTEATGEDVLDGYYVKKQEGVGTHGANLYSIQKDDGETVQVWGTTALNGEMDKVRLGQYIRIQWLGKKLTKAGALKSAKQRVSTDSFHAWEVFIDKTAKPLDQNNFSEPAQSAKREPSRTVVAKDEDLPF